MPRYDYVCDKCGHEFERYMRVAQRYNVVCERCGGPTTKLLARECNLNIFQPMWYNDICEEPIYITSRGQLKEECKKHNVKACRLL